MISKDTKFLIVGLGLIGGSYAKGLSEKGYTVGGISRNIDTINYAVEKGYIKDGNTIVNKEYVSQFDIIIFALYPNTFINWVKTYQFYFKPHALITDVTGVKTKIVTEIQNILRDDVEFVGSHPMAGKEVSGIKNADNKIFKNANYIVTPTEKNTKENIEKVKEIGEILGFKRISCLSITEHDEMIGYLSQLTHCIAVALMCAKDNKDLVKYSGDSFRDLTRIAKINEEMWTELFILNKEELIKQMDLFLNKFNELKEAIINEDKDKLKELMITSTKNRSYFD